MRRSIFPEPHKHEIDDKKLLKYRRNLKNKKLKILPIPPIETFDSRQVLRMLAKKSVVRLGVIQGAHDDGTRCSILVAYNAYGRKVGKALQLANPCPPPSCDE